MTNGCFFFFLIFKKKKKKKKSFVGEIFYWFIYYTTETNPPKKQYIIELYRSYWIILFLWKIVHSPVFSIHPSTPTITKKKKKKRKKNFFFLVCLYVAVSEGTDIDVKKFKMEDFKSKLNSVYSFHVHVIFGEV